MILLEYNNRIIESTLTELATSDKREPLDITLADFDGVQFHIGTPDPNVKNIVTISIQWRAIADLRKHGADEIVRSVYGPLVSETKQGYDYTLKVDLDNFGPDKEALATKISYLKRNVFAAPFKKIFDGVVKGNASKEVVSINYRDEEAIYIKAEGDRALVIFAVSFKDTGDQTLAKVFLQEFADARRTMSNAPSVTYYVKEPPLELKGVPNLKEGERIGYVSFVLFQAHLNPAIQEKTINNIQTFRNYLHYHIKCSKAYMHARMRNRVDELLQVLNRARPEPAQPKEKKLISGRTFVRK